MKKTLILIVLGLTLCMAGCSRSSEEDSSADASTIVIETSTPSPSPSPSPTPVDMVKAEESVKLQAFGTKSATTTEALIKNNTGKVFTEFYVKSDEAEEWGENLLGANGKIAANEEVNVYVEAADTTYDLRATYLDETGTAQTIELDDVNVSDIDFTAKQNVQICMEDGVAYAIYRSLSTKAEVNTKDLAAVSDDSSDDSSDDYYDDSDDYDDSYDDDYYDDSYDEDYDDSDDYDDSSDDSYDDDYDDSYEDDDSGDDGYGLDPDFAG